MKKGVRSTLLTFSEHRGENREKGLEKGSGLHS
jgi:hypothetical protein